MWKVPMWKYCLEAVAVVVLAMAAMVHFADAAASQVSRNKINSLPRAALSPPAPLHGCSSFLAAVFVPSGIEAELKVVPTDRVPYWVDLIHGTAALLLPTPAMSSAISDCTQPHTTSSSQQTPIWLCFLAKRCPSSWCSSDDAASPWDPGSSFFFNLQRRLQMNQSVAGELVIRRFDRPVFNRRSARSIHPGVRVFDAPATPRQRLRRYRRHGQCGLLPLQIQGYIVKRSSFEDLHVIWLL